MISHCGFDLHFLMIRDVEHLFMGLLPSAFALWKNVYSVFLPIFKSGCLFDVELYELFL